MHGAVCNYPCTQRGVSAFTSQEDLSPVFLFGELSRLVCLFVRIFMAQSHDRFFFFFFFKLNKSTCVCAHLMLLIPAGADFLWSDLKTFPRIRAHPHRSRAELTGPHHIWHSVTRMACHDVVVQTNKQKKESRRREEELQAAAS